MPDPLVSVLITSYNHEKYIQQAIEGCLMQQTSFPYEIIIHDDASTDKSAQVIQEFAERYPEVIVPILQKENQYSKGVKIFLTVLIPQARGKYIAICEGDDYWTDPLKLEKQVAVMEMDSSVSMCFTGCRHNFIDNSKKAKVVRHYKGNHFLSTEDIIMKSGDVADTVTLILCKEIYKNLPSWCVSSPVGDAANYLLALLSGRVYYLDEVTAVYNRGVPNSWTTRNRQSTEHQTKYLKKIIEMKDNFDKSTDYQFHRYITKRNNLDIMDLSFVVNEQESYKKQYFSRLTPLQKFECQIFHTFGSRLLWHRFHKVLRLLGGW